MRMLKYSPEHTHCHAFLWFQSLYPTPVPVLFSLLSADTTGFRVTATGVVLDVDPSTNILKKTRVDACRFSRIWLLLKNMLSGALKVAKFEGADV